MLSLEHHTLEAVTAWQHAAGSLEVCGFCALDRFGGQHLLTLTNHAGVPGAFETSQSEEQVARAAAQQRGWEIVAFIHTHPEGPADMSIRDVQCFKRDTLPWVIIGTPQSNPCQCTYQVGEG